MVETRFFCPSCVAAVGRYLLTSADDVLWPSLLSLLVGKEMRALAQAPPSRGPSEPTDAGFIAAAAPSPAWGPIEKVFAEFKEGLAQPVKPIDALTHYDLAMAYWEKGRLGDALESIAVALVHNQALAPQQLGRGLSLCLDKRVLRVSVDEALANLRTALFPA